MTDEFKPMRCFMDGIDWEFHLDGDAMGTKLYPSERALRSDAKCIEKGGCGVAEVEVKFIRWIEEPTYMDKARETIKASESK